MNTRSCTSCITFLICLIVLPIEAQNLEDQLFELPDVIFKKLEASPNFESTHLIKVK